MEDTVVKFNFVNMNKEYAYDIVYNWKYDGIYSFYNMTEDEDDLEEFLMPGTWGKDNFAVLDDERQLVGYYSYSFEDEIMWIGFGLKPELIGKGFGSEFKFIKMKKYINY
ncbi:hypothetical protein KQI42_05040 [Tissierella sp. MSJ-40]|uniref:N-acetyltransferase domain-containing protein n=1 Tax=Tissierella simiarum TaxID=2841534 RepID=A0ABS6E533_9FIRM|nr:hypothetical protein [Tissierella simiarum]MBU5437363.1 hypothetical protein [Tissierella simiarum]